MIPVPDGCSCSGLAQLQQDIAGHLDRVCRGLGLSDCRQCLCRMNREFGLVCFDSSIFREDWSCSFGGCEDS